MRAKKMSIRSLNENIQNIRLCITYLHQKYLKKYQILIAFSTI